MADGEHPFWNRDLLVQLVLYLAVGFFASVIDVGGFALLRRVALPFLIAAPISFLAGMAFNYIASYALAFRRGRYSRLEEMGRMVAVVAIGALLNTGFTLLFVTLGLDEVLGKLAAIPCVFAWNFLARRWLVFHSSLPEGSKRTAERVFGRRGAS